MNKYRVTVFEKHIYELKAKTGEQAREKVLEGKVKKCNAELEGTDTEQIS